MNIDTTMAQPLTYGQVKALASGTRVYAEVNCSHEELSVAGAAIVRQVPERQYYEATVYLDFEGESNDVPELAPSLIDFPDDDSAEIFVPLDDDTSWSYTIYLAKDIPGVPSLKAKLETDLAALESKVAAIKQQLSEL